MTNAKLGHQRLVPLSGRQSPHLLKVDECGCPNSTHNHFLSQTPSGLALRDFLLLQELLNGIPKTLNHLADMASNMVPQVSHQHTIQDVYSENRTSWIELEEISADK